MDGSDGRRFEQRSVAEQSQSNGAHGTAVDKTKASDQTGGGSWRVRGLGALQAGFGVLEVVGGALGGVASSETVVGAVAGGAVAAHGFDDIWAGVQQAKTGKPTETVTQKAVASVARHAGAPPPIAAAVGIAADIAASGGVGGAEKTAVEGTETAVQAAKGAEAASKGAEAASAQAKLAQGFGQRARPAEAKTAERFAAEHPEFNGRTFEAPPPPDPGMTGRTIWAALTMQWVMALNRATSTCGSSLSPSTRTYLKTTTSPLST
jgi:hypothetical protein